MIPPIQRVPEGASDAVRQEMHRAYVAELVKYNPGHFLPPGVRKRWWHLGRVEYPSVLSGAP
jgi:hypothetical protein